MTRYLCLLGACMISLSAPGQKSEDEAWKVQDVIHQEAMGEARFSPDGQAIAWMRRVPSTEKDRFVAQLWLSRLDGPAGKPYRSIRLTQGDDSNSSPRFSADGETLYFLSSRGSGNQLFSLSLLGGEAVALDSFPGGISDVEWLNDSTLLYISEEPPALAELQAEKRKDNTAVIEDSTQFRPRRVFAYDLKRNTSRRLTPVRFPVEEYAASKNGEWLLTKHIRSPHYEADGKPEPQYLLWNLKNGTRSEVLASGFQQAGSFRFSEDGQGIYFASVRSSDPQWQGSGIHVLNYLQIGDKKVYPVDLQAPWGLGGDYEVLGNDVLAPLARGPVNELAFYRRKGLAWEKMPVAAGSYQRHMEVMALSDDKRRCLFVHSTASDLPEYRVAPVHMADNALRIDSGQVLVRLNASLQNKPKAKSEVVYWIGALKDSISGILFYPHDYQPGRKYPLAVAIHGGPSGVDKDEWQDSWAYYPNLLAQRGMFTLMPNYHGSSNHGQAFVESIKKHYYEYEVPDILAGISHLESRGLIARDSMIVMGWSNGAILATKLIVEYPGMFKAASPGAGDVNWSSDYGTCEFGVTFDQSYFGGAPWDDGKKLPYNETYILKSPLFELEKVITPTLLCHGSEDRSVPRDQSWEYHRALQQIGKAPVRFLWFPGQPHGLRKLSHQIRKVEEELAWFDTYLFGKKPEVRPVPEGSPLAQRAEREKALSHQGLLGYLQDKVLLPEIATIAADSIAISVFEITHAQYQQFRPEHRYLLPEANHPAAGLSLADARAYAAWLSQQTGKQCRLPSAEEAQALEEHARQLAAQENTLAYWAGYALPLDEAGRVREALAALKSSPSMACGTFPPAKVGDAKVYDLGGNASEWYEGAGQEGLYGYSAWDFADPANPGAPRDGRGAGIRIIVNLKP